MPRIRWIFLSTVWPFVLALTVSGCSVGATETGPRDVRPQRIVTLDFCADQYVLKFVERDRILAVSPDAGREFSYMRDHAAGLPSVRPVAEDVIILKPGLVVRSYGGGSQASAMYARAGVPVHNVGWAGDIEAIMHVIRETAQALGSPEQGLAVVKEMQSRLAALPNRVTGADALYMTPGGVSSGPGSLIHEMLIAAGFGNFQTRPGWGPIPLERLAYKRPDLIAAGFFESMTNHPHMWSPMRHPVAIAQLQHGAVAPIDGSWTACGAWFLMDAVESLSAAAQR
ncbi:MAG: ABC transporter substrate-binding protein [Halieaceae bacterium]|nr:ABC transporter substrate-binding protein [Halieaceae bacterium]